MYLSLLLVQLSHPQLPFLPPVLLSLAPTSVLTGASHCPHWLVNMVELKVEKCLQHLVGRKNREFNQEYD